MKRIPARYLFVVVAAVVFIAELVVHTMHPATRGDELTVGWYAPPPPTVDFLAWFLALPGLLLLSPFFVVGSILIVFSPALEHFLTGPNMEGLILGASAVSALIFWYSIGWLTDESRELVNGRPRLVSLCLNASLVLSFPLAALGVLKGLSLGDHWCLVGVPPYWVELVGYWILMFWATIGMFFGIRRIRERRAAKQSVTLDLPDTE